MPTDTDIVARLENLEAIEEIKKLKATCCLHVDKHDADSFASLFTEDGEFVGAFQRLTGRSALRDVRFWPFMVHLITNPIIDVNASHATGTWYFLRAYTSPEGEAHWAAGIYEDEYVKMAQGWRFKSVKITNFFACAYSDGWEAQVAEQAQR